MIRTAVGRSLPAAALAAVGTLGLASAPALAVAPVKARIIENTGMAKVRLGMTPHQVRAHWGPPAKAHPCLPVSGLTDVRSCAWDVGRRGSGDVVEVRFFKARVAYIATRSPGWKTKGGAAPGIKITELTPLYRGSLATVATGVAGSCVVADLTGSARATDFTFSSIASAPIVGATSIRIYDPAKVSWDASVVAAGRPAAGTSPGCPLPVGANFPTDGPFVGVKWIGNA